MTLTTASSNLSMLPQIVGDLIVRPVTEESSATRVSTVVPSGGNSYRLPIVTGDGSLASWVAEGAEIAVGQPSLGELVIPFVGLKALVPISNELLADNSPEASKIIGDSIARDIAAKLDTAFWGTAVAGAPAGIKSLTTTVVSAGGSWANIDPFIEAIFTAAGLGATITNFVANPADALLLAKLKQSADSNINLLTPVLDGDTPRLVLAGTPLLLDPAVTVGEVWAIPRAFSFVIIRDDPTIEVDKSVYFTSDRSAVRAVLRVGVGHPYPMALVKVTKV